jgi:hypothetical protein
MKNLKFKFFYFIKFSMNILIAKNSLLYNNIVIFAVIRKIVIKLCINSTTIINVF